MNSSIINITIGKNGQPVVSSRDIAERFEKQHKHVLETIQNLAAENSAAKSLFYESTFENRGKQYPMYYMNRDGFSLLAMGFTGSKALEWKLKYVEAFNKMEEEIRERRYPNFGSLSPSLQTLIQHELALQEQTRRIDGVENKVSAMAETLVLASPAADWQKAMNSRMNRLCVQYSLDHEATRSDLYKSLEDVARVNLTQRLNNLRKRMHSAGSTKSQISAASRLAVIANDPKLRAIYEAQFNKLAAAYMANSEVSA